MEGTTLVIPCSTPEVADLQELFAELRQEVADLRQQVGGLQRENLELRQQAGYWKSQHFRQAQRLKELEQEVEHLRGQNRKLQDQLFGRKSEKGTRQDRSNDLDDPHEPKTKRSRGQQRGKPGPQRRDYSHLLAQEDWVALPPDQCQCPRCGAPVVEGGGSEDSEVIEIDVQAYRRVVRRRRYRRTCNCTDSPLTVTAPPPPKLIPKGRYGVSVWVEILLAKYGNYQPTERLLSYWSQCGLELPLGTVTGGLQTLEPLFTPLAEAIGQRNQQAVFTQADETRWLVYGLGVSHEGGWWWLWVFVGPDTVFYVLDPRRSHDVPQKHYAEPIRRILMVDRYSAYKAMDPVKEGTIVLVFCWAHVRRDFVRVGKGWPELTEWALTWLRSIRSVYRLQRQRLQERDHLAASQEADAGLRRTITDMQARTTRELADPKLRPPCRKTLLSLQEHWIGLTRFVDDRRIPLDNNASERQARGPAMGRKNYFGSGALWSGRLAAMLFALFATLRLGKLNPRLWLKWYLQSCAEAGGKAPADIGPFLPWNLSAEQRLSLAASPPSPTPTPAECLNSS